MPDHPSQKPSASGWCPFATPRVIASTHHDVGRSGHKIKAVVLHIAAGPMSAVFPTFNNTTRLASAHFCVGKDGTIEQYVSIDDTAYAVGMKYVNGQWFNPSNLPSNPSWQDIEPLYNPNMYTISIEHEGQPEDQWTPQMYDANNRLLQWIAAQCNLDYVPHHTLIGHFEIDPVSRPHCPGPNVDFDKISRDANVASVSQGTLNQIQASANEIKWLPINTSSALYEFAQTNKLGNPQTNEFDFQISSDLYLGQVFNFGIVYAKRDDWGNIRSVKKPNGALPSDPTAAAAVAAAQKQTWMSININSGFYKFAQANNLGDPQTDEFDLTVDDEYRGQVYNFGFVYAKKSSLGDIKWIAKSNP